MKSGHSRWELPSRHMRPRKLPAPPERLRPKVRPPDHGRAPWRSPALTWRSLVPAPARLDGANAESRPKRSPVTPGTAGFRSQVDGAILGGVSARQPERGVRKPLPMRSLNRLSNLSPLLNTAVPTCFGKHCDHGGTPVTYMENRWCFNGLAGGRWPRLVASTASGGVHRVRRSLGSCHGAPRPRS